MRSGDDEKDEDEERGSRKTIHVSVLPDTPT
jgi:hypothetical protein